MSSHPRLTSQSARFRRCRPVSRSSSCTAPQERFHCHLDGSLRLQTSSTLAASKGSGSPRASPTRLFQLISPVRSRARSRNTSRRSTSRSPSCRRKTRCNGGVRDRRGRAQRRTAATWKSAIRPWRHTRRGLRLTNIVEAVLAGAVTPKGSMAFAMASSCGIGRRRRNRRCAWPSCASAYKTPRRGRVRSRRRGIQFPAKDHKEASS